MKTQRAASGTRRAFWAWAIPAALMICAAGTWLASATESVSRSRQGALPARVGEPARAMARPAERNGRAPAPPNSPTHEAAANGVAGSEHAEPLLVSSNEVAELLRSEGLLDAAEEARLTELFTLAVGLQESADGAEEGLRQGLQRRMTERLRARLLALLGDERWSVIEPHLWAGEGSVLRVSL